MSIRIESYNLLLYEPKGTKPGLKIGSLVLDQVEKWANHKFLREVMPEMAEAGIIPKKMSLPDFTARPHDIPDSVAEGIDIPEDECFTVNSSVYKDLGRIPEVLGDLARVHEQLSDRGISVSFFNTACPEARRDYERLAELMPEFPAIDQSTWVVTQCLRAPIPDAFRRKLTEKNASNNKRRAVSTGCPCTGPIGDSIVLRTRTEAADVIFQRLKHVRRAKRALA